MYINDMIYDMIRDYKSMTCVNIALLTVLLADRTN